MSAVAAKKPNICAKKARVPVVSTGVVGLVTIIGLFCRISSLL